jgi:hypothetical protein
MSRSSQTFDIAKMNFDGLTEAIDIESSEYKHLVFLFVSDLHREFCLQEGTKVSVSWYVDLFSKYQRRFYELMSYGNSMINILQSLERDFENQEHDKNKEGGE